ncbi:hypothetical protein GF356_07905 [candidate division GN15 bacterium]|nr:hypothetical protein [candidate division GN15 bacterium]
MCNDRRNDSPGRINHHLLSLITVVISMVAAYFLTIQSLKVDLAAKAESVVVETLDKKLAAFEILLREGVVDREQFYQFSRQIEARLSRIEYYLKEQTGGTSEEP